MPAGRPLLDISTEAPEVLTVRINGTEFPLADPTEMELSTHLAMDRCRARLVALATADPTAEDMRALRAVADEMVRAILPTVPDEVHKALRDEHRVAIMNTYARVHAPAGVTNG